MYSFGVIMWEILVQQSPWSEAKRKWDIMDAVVRGERLQYKAGQHSAPCGFEALMERCWQQV